MPPRHPLADTYGQILREQLPNLFRLYVNPYVVQTCYCLSRYVESTWPGRAAAAAAGAGVNAHGGAGAGGAGAFQTFLANGFDEALSGAIKLARYVASVAGRPTAGLIVDPAGRLGPFAAAPAAGGGTVEFLPGLTVVAGADEPGPGSSGPFGFVVLMSGAGAYPEEQSEAVHRLVHRDAAVVIRCVDRADLAALRGARAPVSDSESARTAQTGGGAAAARRSGDGGRPHGEPLPDIVVFDESFADRHVPFGAFTASRALYDHWNRPGKSTFHSTTYQPNTISSLHFVRCLEQADSTFYADVAADLGRIERDFEYRAELFRRLYSPSLYGAIRQTGCDTPDQRAAGAFVYVGGRQIFDGVSGVACSVRGHNPAAYLDEIERLGDAAHCQAELAARLRDLTGLPCVLAAVSGGSAVENALKLALVAQYPRRHVLALKSGFGGKTLFALTGTARAAYKEHVGPLYPDVTYIDPFAPDALARIDAVIDRHEVAVVQMELIQGVGGVRQVPQAVVHHLTASRQRGGYLLLIDEVQTGMYRTGPFTASAAAGLTPDLLVVGKGVSDMMFPFALLLYSAAVQDSLDRAGSDLPQAVRARYGYEFGYKTALNVLRQAEALRLPARVAESAGLFAKLLGDGLAGCQAVREVRVYGLLIGIELAADRGPRRWVKRRLFWFYLLAMLRHRRYPVLVGFCQYEPNVLKITPPLTAGEADIRAACATIVEVLRRPFHRLAAAVLGNLARVKLTKARRHNDPRHNDGQDDARKGDGIGVGAGNGAGNGGDVAGTGNGGGNGGGVAGTGNGGGSRQAGGPATEPAPA